MRARPPTTPASLQIPTTSEENRFLLKSDALAATRMEVILAVGEVLAEGVQEGLTIDTTKMVGVAEDMGLVAVGVQ